MGVRVGAALCGVNQLISGKAGQASTPAPRAGELVGTERVSAPSALFGFLAPGGREAGGISSPQMKRLFAKK